MTVASMPIESARARSMPVSAALETAKEISAPNHNTNFNAERGGARDVAGDAGDRRRMQAEPALAAGQRFAG